MMSTHPALSFPAGSALTRPERDAAMVVLRAEGHTLAAIAEEFGMTRERVRQIVVQNGGPTRVGVKRIRAAKERVRLDALRDRALDHLDAHPGLTLAELARALGEDRAEVRTALGSDARRLLAPTPRRYARTSDEELLGELRLAAGLVRGPLTGQAYDRIERTLGLHSRVRILQRFDTWVRACELAGVVPGSALRDNYQRRWSRPEMLQWVARYLADPGSPGTYAGYTAFARRTDGAPSSPTVRNAIGTWSTIKAEALRLGVVSSALFDDGFAGWGEPDLLPDEEQFLFAVKVA